jgi:hypothetical protein
MRTAFLVLCIISFSFCSYGQADLNDTISEHPFRKSILFSALIPGGGQVYNSIIKKKGFKHAIWKVPLIYGALGATTYMLVQNHQTQRSLKTEYLSRIDGIVSDPQWAAYDDQGVLYLYRQYLDQRDLSILAIGAVYLLQIIDAGVESHFINFDVSENLSLEVHPVILQSQIPGININLKFR